LKEIDIVVWASDFSTNSGEGILANSFFKEFIKFHKNKKIIIKTFEQKIIFLKKNLKTLKIIEKNNFFHKYIGPVYGAIYLLLNRKKKIVYLNYLPLWNFLIFIILPRKTVLGPITGGAEFLQVNNFNTYLRKYIFPLLYKISLIIINIKFKKVIFSTNLLASYLNNNQKKNFLLNYIYLNFINHKDIKKNKKSFDLIFYNRKNLTKKNFLIKQLILRLPSEVKICVIGELILKDNVKNYGFVDKKKVIKLVKKSKLAFASSENILSLFVIDAYNCKTGIIFDKNMKNLNTIISKKIFLPVDLTDLGNGVEEIQNYIINFKFIIDTNFQKFLNSQKQKITTYLKEYFSLYK
jgi:hypothetical protein